MSISGRMPQVSFFGPPKLFASLSKEAIADGISVSELLRRILRERYEDSWRDPLLLMPGDCTLVEWCDTLRVTPRAVLETVNRHNLTLKGGT